MGPGGGIFHAYTTVLQMLPNAFTARPKSRWEKKTRERDWERKEKKGCLWNKNIIYFIWQEQEDSSKHQMQWHEQIWVTHS